MTVKIELTSYLQPFTGGKEIVEVEGETVGECLKKLVKQFPALEKRLFAEKDRLFDFIAILINEEDVIPDAMAQPVKDGDKLQIYFVIGGG